MTAAVGTPPAAWPLVTVISGLQTGADQAGLFVAEALGYQTGGWATRGFRTESGPAPDLGRRFGLAEAPGDDYAVRTLLNVRHSDGTVIFGDVEEGGTALTVRLAAVYKGIDSFLTNPTPAQVVKWIEERQIATLNVAGNRLSKRPTVYDEVVQVLGQALWRPGRPPCVIPPVALRPVFGVGGRVRR